MKHAVYLFLVLLASGPSFADSSIVFRRENFADGVAAFHDVRIPVAGKMFFLSTFQDENGIDPNYNPDSFCRSQSFEKSIRVLNVIDYSAMPLTFSTYGKSDLSSLLLHPENNSYRFSAVYCMDERRTSLLDEREAFIAEP